MPAVTDRSNKAPLLQTGPLNHGTLACIDIAVTRRFYEEVLGMEVIQTSPRSLMVRKGGDYVYACVELPAGGKKMDMEMLNHNGFEVSSPEEVNKAYETVLAIKDEWGIKRVTPPRVMHGDHTFYFMDMDGNWWEVVYTHGGRYVDDFDTPHSDMSGRHDLEHWIDIWNKEKKLMHMHEPGVREMAKAAKAESEK
jgi:catechol 2,3-dioxygenase-like lactoylglutathione lyase family enzyme